MLDLVLTGQNQSESLLDYFVSFEDTLRSDGRGCIIMRFKIPPDVKCHFDWKKIEPHCKSISWSVLREPIWGPRANPIAYQQHDIDLNIEFNAATSMYIRNLLNKRKRLNAD